MSDNEVESFEITDEDLMGEFFPGHKRRKFTKEEAIYGLWARPGDEDDNSGGKYGRDKRKKDYTRPMQFVSGGVVVKGKDDPQKAEDDQDEMNIDSSDEEAEPSQEEVMARVKEKEKEKKKLFNAPKTLQTTKGSKKGSIDFSRQVQKNVGKEFGSWEKHTKGFGMKMLEKMGYQPGKGLGKDGEGISVPVEVIKRAGRGAVGAYGTERPKNELRPQVDIEEEEENNFRQQLSQWKKTSDGEKKQPKYVYRTVDEVKASGKSKKPSVSIKHSKVKVVDMTGPETKILSGYGALSTTPAKPDELPKTIEDEEAAFAMPELQYNLNILVDMTESDILQIDRQLRHEKDTIVNLRYEEEKITKDYDEEEKHIEELTKVLNLVNQCKSISSSGNQPPLATCEEIFKTLQGDYYEFYKMYELGQLAIPVVFPMIKAHLSVWQPLRDPQYGLDVVKRWKDLLQSDKQSSFTLTQAANEGNNMDVYEKLIWDVWMPIIRTVVGIWQPREPDPVISIIETWLPVLPPWVTENILAQLILPRLQAEVDIWNPLTDPIPIHAWLHPWLPLMGDKLEPLYAPIRYKLSSALLNWHPSDPSAKLMVEPWVKVFSKGTLDAFLLRSIFPKLSECLGEFVINPHQQHLEPFHWVMSWKSILPHQHFVSLMEKSFFPRWIQVLRKWLSNQPNYDEVTKWYIGWKSMFSEDLLANATIKAQFNRALDIMNHAVTGALQPGARENIAYLTSTERRREAEAAATAAAEKQRSQTEAARNVGAANIPSNFKDMIQKMAEDANLLFMPIPNRRLEGKTLYSLGRVTLYLDHGVAFVQSPSAPSSWIPVSVPDLIKMAK